MPRGCCGEPECRRRSPIALYRGDFTGQVYAATASRLVAARSDGTATYKATNRHDITDAMRRFILANADWVQAVLAERSS